MPHLITYYFVLILYSNTVLYALIPYYRFHKVYDSLYNLCLEEDSIRPEKYTVEGYPPMNAFPANHPNRVLYMDTMGAKDEL